MLFSLAMTVWDISVNKCVRLFFDFLLNFFNYFDFDLECDFDYWRPGFDNYLCELMLIDFFVSTVWKVFVGLRCLIQLDGSPLTNTSLGYLLLLLP